MPKPETIPVAEPWFGPKERRLVNECVRSGWVSSQGRFVDEFERLFSGYCGGKYGVATSSGTTALHLALACLDIGPGDEVIVPTLSFIATANAVTYAGAKPVFVDSDPGTWNLDPRAVERAVTRRSRAIIAVHLYGHPAPMKEINAIAKRHGLHVIEDACEAHGGEYYGKRVGGLGAIGCFSFYGNKVITTGEGGMLVTNDSRIAEKAKSLRDHGMSKSKRYWHPRIGFNYRMTNLQAALGVAQLERIERVIQRKRKNARLYNSLLGGLPGIALPPEAPWAKNIYWLYTILVKGGRRKKRIVDALDRQGIETRPVFYPISDMPPYRNGRGPASPIAQRIAQEGLSLPSSPLLRPEQIRRICGIIREFGSK